MITPERLYIATRMTDAVQSLNYPTTSSELRSFLGMCIVYRRSVPDFVRVAAFLKKRLKKSKPTLIKLNEEERQTVDDLKQELITPPILALKKPDGQFTIETGTCNKQVGYVLQQEQENGEFLPIGYWSRTPNDAEKNYATTKREYLPIVWAILLLCTYVKGS